MIDLNTILVLIGLVALPWYSAWVMKRTILNEIPEGAKERGEKILNDLEILITKTKEFYEVK